MEVRDLKQPSWEFSVEANDKLYDFCVTFTSEDALRVVEPYASKGFEAWRQLKLRYTPVGGATEIDRTLRMFNKKPSETKT